MRDKWSLLVITSASNNYVCQEVLDFGSPSWADTAHEKIMLCVTPPGVYIKVVKLY